MRNFTILFILMLAFSCNTGHNHQKQGNALGSREAASEHPDSKSAKNGDGSESNDNAEISSDGPAFRFEETDFNFGSINEGDMVDHSFKFTNVGNKPLVIDRAFASCGCTVPSPPKDPIQPGQSSAIHVRFNSSNKQNQQIKTITIEANTKPSITKLEIHGFVIPKNSSN